MLYVDDAGVVSRSPRGLARMMGVIIVVYRMRANSYGRVLVRVSGIKIAHTAHLRQLGRSKPSAS